MFTQVKHHTTTSGGTTQQKSTSLLQLLLWSELVCVSALLLSAVGGTWRETGLIRTGDTWLVTYPEAADAGR